MADKLSNVIGAPFSEYILTQLYTRAARNTTTQRSNVEVLYLANKTAWARLISSVNIQVGDSKDQKPLTEFYKKLGLGSSYTKPEDLAKNWILEAGTSKVQGQGIGLRSGIGEDGAYGLGGIQAQGYMPMPGLISVQVETVGRLGSLRQANISLRVWNMNQLNVIEALYFRLGYFMLLEWGHTQFFTNPTGDPRSPGNIFTVAKNTFGVDDPFATGLDKTTVQQLIAKKSKETSGNYDGMLGIVSNFNWSFNQEGGYDCNVKLIGAGSIIDTMRINQSYKMPPGLIKPYKLAQESLQIEAEQQAQKAKDEAEKRARQSRGLPPVPPKIPTNPQEIYTQVFTADIGSGAATVQTQEDFLSQIAYTTAYDIQTAGLNTVYDYFYKAQIGGNPPSQAFINELNRGYTGLFLSPISNVRDNWQVVFANESQPVQLSTGQLSLAANRYVTTENISLEDTIGDTPFVKLVDRTIKRSKLETATSVVENLQNLEVDPDEKIFQVLTAAGLPILGDNLASNLITAAFGKAATTAGITLTIPYKARVKDPVHGEEEKTFFITVTYQPPPSGGEEVEKNRLTRREFTTAIKNWFASSRKINITSIESILVPDFGIVDYGLNPELSARKRKAIIVQGTLADLQIPNKTTPIVTITFNNTALISTVLTGVRAAEPIPTAAQAANIGDAAVTENSATATQTEATPGYESALHIMLAYIKTVASAEAVKPENKTKKVVKLDLTETTKAFYEDGIFKDVLSSAPPNAAYTGTPFNLTYYAQKGFNSNLMADALADPALFNRIPFVNFKKLCVAYLTQYQISNQTSDNIEYPVYIQFGYLLAFLNNMCLIYDSKQKVGSNTSPQGQDKNPYVYIDFNPDTNFCLTSPQHLSIDPTVCLIPFQGNDNSYRSIFPSNIVNSVSDIFVPAGQNELSGQIPEFKTFEGNPYQGKTMNILLNVDFLMRTANNFISSDQDHSLLLKSYLEAIVIEINKSLGNQNLFRVAYRDDSNTVQIKDDQWVPGMAGEQTVLNISAPTQPNTGVRLGEIPVFGLQSLARGFQFKTNISTKLGSMIAISAQATTGSVNATDPSSFSYLNAPYQDRFKPYITEASGEPASGDSKSKAVEKKSTDQQNNDLVVADKFNSLVKNIYYDFALDISKIDAAKNYYIERISKTKSTDPVTSAAPFIPADLEITMDGIAGILMGNAFTIPEDRLPLSLRGIPGKPKVGFVVAGLVHTVQDNQWLTKIKGQMIKLRDASATDSVQAINTIQTALKKRARGADGTSFITGQGYPVSQSDIDFANQYVNGILPAVQLPDGTFQIARIEQSTNRYWLQPNPEYVSKLVKVTVPLRTGSVVITVHPDFATKLNSAFAEITSKGLQKYIVSAAGGLAVRNVTGGTVLSFHAWGFALDLNEGLYGYGTNWNSLPLNEFNKGFEDVATIMNKYGISWYKTQDPMHFSIYETSSLIF